jgi:hypothetical protein
LNVPAVPIGVYCEAIIEEKSMSSARFAILVLVACAAKAQEALPPEQPPADEPPTSAVQDAVIEELTVTADRPLGVLRDELRDAENTFYAAFNELVDDPKFKVECDWVAPLGSLIHRRVCQPAYARELQYRATQMALRTGGGGQNPGASTQSSFDPGLVEFASKADASSLRLQSRLMQVMAETIQSNPELMQLFLDYLRSRQTLETALSE